MAVKPNKALAKLRAGKVISGPATVYGSALLAEQVAFMDFDFVWLDWQHGENDERTITEQIARFRGLDSVPLPRVRWNEPGLINRTLDMGAMGVIVPFVETAAEAKAAVDACFYMPKGRRSGGGVRLGVLADSEMEYLYHGNAEIMCVVMVETEAAIGRVREIMAVPGVDVVLIGPGDLMIDVKSRGGDEAKHEALVLEVVKASKETGVAAGYVCGSAEIASKRVEQGFRFINYGLDHVVLMNGLKEVKALADKWGA